MKQTDSQYRQLLELLRQELIPATGCTEPIAIAYAAAVAARELGVRPSRVAVQLSGSIIKNAKSVTIPNTNGLKGIPAAIAAGIIAGDPERKLEVISYIREDQKAEIVEYIAACSMEVTVCDGRLFEIILEVFAGKSSASVHIVDSHTNIVSVQKDDRLLAQTNRLPGDSESRAEPVCLSVRTALDFADSLDISDVKELIDNQIACNSAVSQEGLEQSYGAGVGKTCLTLCPPDSLFGGVIAAAASASDARMGGCDLPVYITAGSGNQGLASSMPVIEYARRAGIQGDILYRALAFSTLVTVHQKNFIGKLSAFCGAVSAGAASAAAIAYLNGGGYDLISHTIVNSLAITSGMVCDGAKPSCAAKIAMAVGAGLLGYEMSLRNRQFAEGEGLVAADVEQTIENIGCLGKEGMKQTNQKILQMMLQ